MKILMVQPRINKVMFEYDPEDTEPFYAYVMPLGMPYISAVLKQAGYDVAVVNLNNEKGLVEDILSEVFINYYDVVFTGGLSLSFPNVRDIVKYIREYSPLSNIVVGGGMVSAQPELMFKLLQPDYGIIYEGEETALELVRTIEQNTSMREVRGIIYAGGKTAPRPAICDLDALPFPDLRSFGYDQYLENQLSDYVMFESLDFPRQYSIVASRSCPGKCTFCFHSTGYKYRQRSIENIMKEVRFSVERYKINHLFFLDELFAYDKPRALEFCKQFEAFAKTVPWEIRIYLNLRVDCADEEVIDALKRAGATVIGLGLESMNQTILDSMRKGTTPKQIQDTFQMLADKTLISQGAYLFGDPKETLETAADTLKFYSERQDIIKGGACLSFIIPFAGSPVYKYCVKNGIIPDEVAFVENLAKNGHDFANPINMTSLSESDFEKLKEMVFAAEYVVPYYSVPKSIKVVDGVTEVYTECPYCHRMETLKNVRLPSGFGRVGVVCRYDDCRGRFHLATRWRTLAQFLVKMFGHQRMVRLRKMVGV